MYDLAIVGGGPAGLTAAIYGQRYGLKTVVLASQVGGLLVENPLIENYPGFRSVAGPELAQAMHGHATGLGAEVRAERVVGLRKKGRSFIVRTELGQVEAKAVVLSHGLRRRKLGVKGEERFLGKGVSYCATCDAPFFRGKKVAVVGGGNSAALASLILSEFASKVFIIYRRDRFFRMQPYYLQKIEGTGKIKPLFKEEIEELLGGDRLEAVKLKTGKELKVDGLFVEIGFQPDIPFETELKFARDGRGFLKVDPGMRTSEPGVFAAGDITTGSDYFWQIATAVAEGAIAARSAYDYLLRG